MLVNSLNQTKSSFSHVFAHQNDEITAIYGGLNYSNPVYYAFDTINGAPPLSFKSNGEAIEDYSIDGNTIQTGTPTENSPIYPSSCGTQIAQGYNIPITISDGTSSENISIPIGTEPLNKIDGYADQINSSEGKRINKIVKLVLDGTESWAIGSSTGTTYFRYVIGGDGYGIDDVGLCSHYIKATIASTTSDIGFNVINSSAARRFVLTIRPINYSGMTVDQFKTFLADQYSNGTPVTVWYVITVPTNETLTLPTIPTINGTNTLTTSTTVLPSNIEATGRIKRII